MMQFELATGHGKVAKAPRIIRGVAFCPYRRGDEDWWGDHSMIVKGHIPRGVHYKHDAPHRLPADWGPTGEPTQVEPRFERVGGVIDLHDQMGEKRTSIRSEHYHILSELFGAPTFFAYPEEEEGEPQIVSVFVRQVYQRPPLLAMFGVEMMDDGPKDGDTRVDLVAFLAPCISNVKHYLTIEERETMIPRFGGVTPLPGEEQ